MRTELNESQRIRMSLGISVAPRVYSDTLSQRGFMRLWVPRLMAMLACASAADLRAADAGLIKIDGPIGPASASYISRAIDSAARRKYVCLIIQLDTPGGLVSSTEDIVKKFYVSPVPTVVYVAPPGAKAASAGCFITIAA